jgi:hypothetical protein
MMAEREKIAVMTAVMLIVQSKESKVTENKSPTHDSVIMAFLIGVPVTTQPATGTWA